MAMHNTKQYKEKLENELKLVESELKSIGRKNPENEEDWEAVPDTDILKSDEDEVADKIDDYETNTGILKQLEIRYHEIKEALERIDAETFGICNVGGEPIEEARLEANPAATTCVKHMV